MSLLQFFRPRARFLDPGDLRDGELQLVQPSPLYADDFLRSAAHPSCAGDPECAVSPAALRAFLESHPNGLEQPSKRGGSPAYRFWMRLHPPAAAEHRGGGGGGGADVKSATAIAGTISLRVGNDEHTRLYYGHVGYLVFPPSRGRRYAERSVRLLLPLARRHGLSELWITTNPENGASRRTCERLGCRLVETIQVPAGHPLWQRGERRKCRYRLPLT